MFRTARKNRVERTLRCSKIAGCTTLTEADTAVRDRHCLGVALTVHVPLRSIKPDPRTGNGIGRRSPSPDETTAVIRRNLLVHFCHICFIVFLPGDALTVWLRRRSDRSGIPGLTVYALLSSRGLLVTLSLYVKGRANRGGVDRDSAAAAAADSATSFTRQQNIRKHRD